VLLLGFSFDFRFLLREGEGQALAEGGGRRRPGRNVSEGGPQNDAFCTQGEMERALILAQDDFLEGCLGFYDGKSSEGESENFLSTRRGEKRTQRSTASGLLIRRSQQPSTSTYLPSLALAIFLSSLPSHAL